jgi:hypothetical protein
MDRRDSATVHRSQRVSAPPHYVVVFTNATTSERIILCTVTGSDAATVEFHHQLTLLRERSVVGELVVLRQDPEETPILRQPIGQRIASTPLTTVPASLADNMPLPGDVSGGFAVEAAEGG